VKPNNVSVSVSQFNGELFVNITMKLKGQPLDYEPACPPNVNPIFGDVLTLGNRIGEHSRKRKCKLLQKFIEQLEFENDL
jgi:hypothetical protein